MTLIKLNAIDSTNNYLKQLSKVQYLENYTIVLANEQTNGRGQMGTVWSSEAGKNLTVSVLVKDLDLNDITIYEFNVLIALAAVETVLKCTEATIQIKWPNDIMADGKKIAGILIENTYKSNLNFTSVVGLGMNLNQTNFDYLPQANSLVNITGVEWDPEFMATKFVENIKKNSSNVINKKEELWERYNQLIFKRNIPSAFEDTVGNRFMGIITSVNEQGQLVVVKEDDSIHSYELKQVKMLF